jgi:hypothetical protein
MFRVAAQAEDRVAGPVAAQEAVRSADRRRQDLRDRSRCRDHSNML